MKILFVQKVKGYSGSEKFILEAMAGLNKRGINCHFLAVYQQKEDLDNLAYRFEQKGIHAIYLQSDSDLNFKLLKAIHKIIKQGDYNILHSNLIHSDVWLALIRLLFRNKTPLISTKHNYDEAYVNEHGFDVKPLSWRQRYYFLSYWAEKMIDYSITISDGLYKLYDEGKITPPAKLRTITYGFDLPQFDPPTESTCRLAPYQLVIVGRLIYLKGHHFVLQILGDLAAQFPAIKLVIIGEGEERENIEQLTQKLNLENHVVLTGYQNNVLEWMNQSDIVLVSSISEGFGIVILEAFNSRTATIAFDVPAPNEIIEHQKTGILVPPFDLEILKTEITQLLQNKEKRNKMSEVAYEKLMSYYTLDRMLDEYEEVYEVLLTNS